MENTNGSMKYIGIKITGALPVVSFFHLFFSGVIFFLATINTAEAQWCNSPACTGGTNFNQIDNRGALVPTTNRQVTNQYTGGSCGGGTEHKIYYSFVATIGLTYVFDLGGMGIDGLTDNDIRIYNGVCASGAMVGSGTTPICDNNGYVEWTCTSSGTYYVVPQYSCGNFSECMNVRMGYYYLDLAPGCTAASFFDNGGLGGSGTSRGGVGSNNLNYFQGSTGYPRTYLPSNPANKTNVTFSSFATQAGTDFLYVYDGNSTAAPQVAGSPFSGSALPGGALGITSTAADGSLTFRFTSNGGLPLDFVVGAGWNASISAGLPSVSAGADQSICNGQNTTLNGSGGGPYIWSPSAGLSCTTCANPVASPTISTTYTLSSTNGCGTVTDAAIVTVNNVPAINAGTDKTICIGQNATLNGSGGGTYNWSPSTGLSCTTCANPVASPTTFTTYTVNSTNGCGSASDIVTVTVNALPTANAGSNATICNGQSATLSGTGGGTYNWSPSTGLSCTTCANPVASPATPTTYTLTVTDGLGCTDTDPASVTVNSLPTANAGSNATICNGQSATLTATGGGTYFWNTGGTTAVITVSPTANTNYTVTVTNGNGCTDTDITAVTVSSPPTANISGAASVCSGSPITLTASGGGTYSWNTGATTSSITVSPTTGTTYSVIAFSGSCSDTAATSVSISALPTASVTGNSNLCAGQSTTLSASGGTSYSWNTGATTTSITVSPTTGTSYTVTVSNVNGCTDTDVMTVNVAPPPTASVSGNTTICSGQSATITASGGLTYSWNTGATTSSISVSPTTGTTYSVIVSAGNCSDTTSTMVAVNPAPTANINTASTTLCSGQNATLTATGGGTYSWSTGATTAVITVAPTTATSYSVIVSNGLCTNSSSVNFTVNPPVTANISSSSTTICSGTNATLTASGGTFYSWNTGATTSFISVSPTSGTTYSVVVSNGTCSSTVSANIAVNTSPTATISATGNSICSGQSATLTASGGGTYQWNTGSTTNSISVSPTLSTTYTVIVTSANGCTGAATTAVTVTPSPAATISSNTTICAGEAAVLIAGGGSTYVWSPGGQTTSSILVNPSANTNYTVTVSNGGCTDAASTSVTVNPVPTANAGIDVTITNGNSTTLSATGGGTYLWNTGEVTQSITVSPSATTSYTVIVTNANGCTDAAVVTVYIEYDCGEFFIPNAFSPNEDTKNDILYVRSKCLKTMHFVIYDRWGVNVFETEDITQGWNGFYKSDTGNTAVFNYIINYELLTGVKGQKKGTITLVR